jgi:hypothetical protein
MDQMTSVGTDPVSETRHMVHIPCGHHSESFFVDLERPLDLRYLHVWPVEVDFHALKILVSRIETCDLLAVTRSHVHTGWRGSHGNYTGDGLEIGLHHLGSGL